MTSTIPAAVDWLVENITALPSCASPVKVFDGFPTAEVATYVVVVGAVTTTDVRSALNVVTIGQPQAQVEAYSVTVEIHSSTGSTNQKLVRDAVFAIYDEIHALIRTNPQLGTAVQPAIDAAQIRAVSLTQTDLDQAAEGRSAVLAAEVYLSTYIA